MTSTERTMINMSINGAPGFNNVERANRLDFLDYFHTETLWHEAQHELHFKRMREVYQVILNSPANPGSVAGADAASARQNAQNAIVTDRNNRLRAALYAGLQCSGTEFHAATENDPNSYEGKMWNCGCTGIGVDSQNQPRVANPALCDTARAPFDFTAPWPTNTTPGCQCLYANWSTGIPTGCPPVPNGWTPPAGFPFPAAPN